MRNCEESLYQMSAYLDGMLSETEKSELVEHLEECPTCRTLWEEFSALHHTCCNLPELSTPDGFVEKVQARIRQEDLQKKRRISIKVWKRTVWGVAAACVIFCIGIASRHVWFNENELAMKISLPQVPTEEGWNESERVSWGSAALDVDMRTQVDVIDDEVVLESMEDEEEQMTSSISGAGRQVVAILVLMQLPQGSELWVENEQTWEREGETMVCFVDAECAYALMELAEEQGLILEYTEMQEERQESGICKLVLVVA